MERRPLIDHLALEVSDYERSKAFYAAALQPFGAATDRDNGAPGLRPEYQGADVLDPDGNNVEAVCHDPE